MSILDVRRMYRRFCKSANTPLSLKAALLLEHDESQLCNLSVNPRDYQDPDAFAVDYQVASFLKKWPGLRTGINTREVALEAFFEGERRLYNVNKRLGSPEELDLSSLQHIFVMQQKISELLGPFSMFKVDRFGWGPGVTSSLKGRCSTFVHKIREDQMSVTSDALDLAQSVVGSDLHWLRARGIDAYGPCSLLSSEFKVVRGSRLLTVPKDATKDRCIAAEPTLNIFLQKGVGSYIRTRLQKVGIDLDDQTRNQNMASKAYSNQLSTIDLENASNSVSTSLVELLLPPEWFAYLDSIRCKWTTLNGRNIKLEMFSSMGNGFTFELESLIFWAAATTCSTGAVGVYGDDIIVAQKDAAAVIRLLSTLGFKTNVKKTFVDGCFFESCGKHYFKGVDVTPLYWRNVIQSNDENQQEWLQHRLVNALYRRISLIQANYEEAVLRHYRWSLSDLWREAIRSVEIRYVIPTWCEGDEGYCLPDVSRFVKTYGKYGRMKLPTLKIRGRRRFSWSSSWQASLLAYALRFEPDISFEKDGVGLRGDSRIQNGYTWFGASYGP